MPHLKSLWPDVPPAPDYLNVYEAIIGQPHHDQWPDYTAHVEEETGKTLTFKQLRKRIGDLAAALIAPASQGGLGLRAGDDKEIIGIMSENSSVRVQ